MLNSLEEQIMRQLNMGKHPSTESLEVFLKQTRNFRQEDSLQESTDSIRRQLDKKGESAKVVSRKKQGIFGLDFELPEELSQLISQKGKVAKQPKAIKQTKPSAAIVKPVDQNRLLLAQDSKEQLTSQQLVDAEGNLFGYQRPTDLKHTESMKQLNSK